MMWTLLAILALFHAEARAMAEVAPAEERASLYGTELNSLYAGDSSSSKTYGTSLGMDKSKPEERFGL